MFRVTNEIYACMWFWWYLTFEFNKIVFFLHQLQLNLRVKSKCKILIYKRNIPILIL